jgi:hypothetical protein
LLAVKVDDGLDLEVLIDQADVPAHCDVAVAGWGRLK